MKKEVRESSHRNKTQEEIEKYEVVKLDRAEDKIFKCNKVNKVWRQKKYIKVHTEIKHRKKWKKIEVVTLDRDKGKILSVIRKKLWRKRSTWKFTQK